MKQSKRRAKVTDQPTRRDREHRGPCDDATNDDLVAARVRTVRREPAQRSSGIPKRATGATKWRATSHDRLALQ